MDSKTIKAAKKVLEIEQNAIGALSKRIDKNFIKAVDTIFFSTGRVVVTGMGKPGFIGRKISATLASTGTPSLFMHPAEAIHGDIGMVLRDDVVLAISNSGETEEIVRLIPMVKRIGSKMICLTGNKRSVLAKNCDCVLDVEVDREACPMGLAPTASTTAALAMGDALAVALLERRKFKKEDYALLHPGGALGKKLLLKAKDVMRTGKNNPALRENTKVKEVLISITKSHSGAASIIDKSRKLIGIFTDGDLRRAFEKDLTALEEPVSVFMTRKPKTIVEDQLAAEALRMMKDSEIDELPVVDSRGKCAGMLDIQDLLKSGIF